MCNLLSSIHTYIHTGAIAAQSFKQLRTTKNRTSQKNASSGQNRRRESDPLVPASCWGASASAGACAVAMERAHGVQPELAAVAYQPCRPGGTVARTLAVRVPCNKARAVLHVPGACSVQIMRDLSAAPEDVRSCAFCRLWGNTYQGGNHLSLYGADLVESAPIPRPP